MEEFKPTISELLQRIETARQQMAQTLQSLSEAEMISRPEGEWSIKDHLAHLIPWMAGITALLRHENRWAAMGLEAAFVENNKGFEAMNGRLFEQYKDWSLAQVMAGLEAAHQDLERALSTLTDDDLLKGYGFFESYNLDEGDKRPIIGWLAGDTFEHYAEHQEWIEARLHR